MIANIFLLFVFFLFEPRTGCIHDSGISSQVLAIRKGLKCGQVGLVMTSSLIIGVDRFSTTVCDDVEHYPPNMTASASSSTH